MSLLNVWRAAPGSRGGAASWWPRTAAAWEASRRRVLSWGPEGGDAILYGLSALFALGVAIMADKSTAEYRQWAAIAGGPYLVAAAISAICARRARSSPAAGAAATPGHRTPDPVGPGGAGVALPDGPGGAGVAAVAGGGAQVETGRRWGPLRVWLFLIVLVGATLAPLAVEVSLRAGSAADATSHVQPEVLVIDQAALRLVHGKDPYHAEVVHGHVRSAVRGEPQFESFFPYLPLMAVFGLPSSTHASVKVTDTRLVFSVVTLLVVGVALLALRAPREHTVRALQVLTVLPSAALPLATGGDDLPIVAFLLLAMVLAQRRRPGWSGVVLGVVSAMKFTAWPLAVLALFAARDRDGRRAPVRMALGIVVVAGPVVAPFAADNARAFIDNVILFPLGLSGVASPAASNLPGHLIVNAFPGLHHVLPVVVGVVGGLWLLRHLVRHTPATAGAVCTLTGWVMLVAICFAPATRVGYLLYPLNFFVWGWMFKATERQEYGDPAAVPRVRLGVV